MVLRRRELVQPLSTVKPAACRNPERTAALHHRVYVIELAADVLTKKRMLKANPACRADLPALYVGQTGLTPEARFAKHRSGVKANAYVRDFGMRLRPDLCGGWGAMTWEQSCIAERQLAERLREAGYAVWTN
ncbi:MAG: hypothetical protein RL760_827 [Candidatus Eisenbacteria bacterium]